MSKIIRIKCAVVDTVNLTLYKEDGTTMIIKQGDPRVRKILEVAIPEIAGQGYADVDVSEVGDSTFADFENQQAKSGGLIRLYKIAKAKLVGLFESNIAPEMQVGELPEHSNKIEHTMSVVDEIIAHAVPVQHDDYHETNVAKQAKVVEDNGRTPDVTPETNDPDTIIAVVDGKIIPGMEKIKSQFVHANKMGSTIGVENFLKRLASVIDKRSHSVEDLLKFMERADTPIADDGSIIIYKVLRKQDDKYVDCHTRKVPQWIGAYVTMDEKLVDHVRNNECSNGLHVARRGYIHGFSGDVCVLAKLAPEDVITVPSYDANKMRVCGYHIIAELTNEMYGRLKSNQPLTNTDAGKELLASAIRGDHIHRTDEVRITGQQGHGVVITKLEKVKQPKEVMVDVVKITKAEALENPEEMKMELATNPLEVVEKVQTSRKEQAKALYAAFELGEPGSFEKLQAFKKASKTSWEKLGITDPTTVKRPTPKQIGKVKKAKSLPQVHDVDFGNEPMDRTGEIDKPEVKASPREQIKQLLKGKLTKDKAQQILDIKKKSKKSWEYLGLSERQVDDVEFFTK